ncbi:hypothetical protein D0861_08238 [Hortaea werneckii]|uniref:Stress-associated endoplasmic reticulum protein n=1 Tax=Hortaea werneckii TaxID=91943 RepID=A0A3M7EZR5_HORWE|nr:hypothetical protein D0861_08238 [Hortaea werneckii]
MAQTPQQRRANNTFAKAEERKRGKPQGEVQRNEKPTKAPISKTWVCKYSPSTEPLPGPVLLLCFSVALWSSGAWKELKDNGALLFRDRKETGTLRGKIEGAIRMECSETIEVSTSVSTFLPSASGRTRTARMRLKRPYPVPAS